MSTTPPRPVGSIKAIGLVVNSEREGAVHFAENFSQWLEGRGVSVCATQSVTHNSEQADEAYHCLVDDSDMVIVLGGDGSLLGASRRAAPAGKPILGIHWGGMGFLNECHPESAHKAIDRILEGDYFLDSRLMLLAELWRDGKLCFHCPALNDVAVTRDTLSRILRLEVSVGDETAAAYKGDGIIISTPTGSTAHSLSAGGPVLDPRVDAFVITPICPHSFNGRAIVVPAAERIRVYHSTPLANVVLTVDGQIGAAMLPTDRLEISRAPWPAQFVRFRKDRFYHTLRDKLNWKI